MAKRLCIHTFGWKQEIFLGNRFIWLNVVITFLVGGLWHGSNLTFVVWGLYHGLLLSIERPLRKYLVRNNIEIPKFLKQVITFHLVTFGWILFNSETFDKAKILTSRIFTDFSFSESKLTLAIFILIIAGIGLQFIRESFSSRLLEMLSAKPIFVQALFYGTCLFLLSTFSDNVSAFLYGFF